MSEQTYLKILRWGIYLSLLTPFFVFESLLFPFITSKAFYFRILIEILFVFYILFLYQYPSNIPKKKGLTLALLIFAAIFFLTSLTSIDFNLSFWGDIERMEGAFGFLHLLAYAFIIFSVFKTKNDWRKLIQVFLGTSALLCFYGLGQKLGMKSLLLHDQARISSRLGNSIYLGAYVLFGIAFSLLLLNEKLHETEHETAGEYNWRWAMISVYGLILMLHLIILFFTGTRGAYLGFIAAIFYSALMVIFFVKEKWTKLIGLGIIIILIISGVFLFKFREAELIKSNHYLYRLSHISFKDATWNTRLLSWKAGWRGFKEKPILGIGSGNYAYFFDKYFDPAFYTFTAQETFFDHAHNNVIDVTVTLGIFGLLSYLAIWCYIIYYLVLDFKEKYIGFAEFIILGSLLIAYFLQNLFVFDCLVTYLGFFILAGYISYRRLRLAKETDCEYNAVNKFNPFLAVILSIFSLFLAINYNLRPAWAMQESVQGQYEIARNGNLPRGKELYEKALSRNTVLDRDIRGSFINILTRNSLIFIRSGQKDAFEEAINFAIIEGEKNLKLNPEDTMMNIQMGELYNLKSQIIGNRLDVELGYNYLEKALNSSPGRLQIHFSLANNRLIANDFEKAFEILLAAREMNNAYPETYSQLARAYLIKGDRNKYYEILGEAVQGGYANVTRDQINEMIEYFQNKKEYNVLVPLYKNLIVSDPNDAILYAKIAVVYKELGEIEEAKNAVGIAVEINPDLKKEAEIFLKNLKY